MSRAGWNAKGRLKPIYDKVGGVKALSDLTGIPQTNLSSINGGKHRTMTIDYARRIMAAVPEVTPLDLGAPTAEFPEESALLLDRLEELAGLVDDGFARLEEGIARVERRLGRGDGRGREKPK